MAAESLISVDDPAFQLSVFKKVVNDDLSVRQVENLVRSIGKRLTQPKSGESQKSNEFSRLQNTLSSHFESRVLIKTDGNKGEIKIPFESIEDLNRILEIIEIQ